MYTWFSSYGFFHLPVAASFSAEFTRDCIYIYVYAGRRDYSVHWLDCLNKATSRRAGRDREKGLACVAREVTAAFVSRQQAERQKRRRQREGEQNNLISHSGVSRPSCSESKVDSCCRSNWSPEDATFNGAY